MEPMPKVDVSKLRRNLQVFVSAEAHELIRTHAASSEKSMGQIVDALIKAALRPQGVQ